MKPAVTRFLTGFQAAGRSDIQKALASGAIGGLNAKAQVITGKASNIRTFDVAEIALYHALGKLPEPSARPRFLLANREKVQNRYSRTRRPFSFNV